MPDIDPVIAGELKLVLRARRRSEKATALLRASIVSAVQRGASHASVATAAGLSRGRVSQIIAEERRP